MPPLWGKNGNGGICHLRDTSTVLKFSAIIKKKQKKVKLDNNSILVQDDEHLRFVQARSWELCPLSP